MVKALQYRCLHDFIECCQVDDHAGFAVDGAADKHLNDIVVPVAVWVVALAVGCSIFLIRRASAWSRWLALSMYRRPK